MYSYLNSPSCNDTTPLVFLNEKINDSFCPIYPATNIKVKNPSREVKRGNHGATTNGCKAFKARTSRAKSARKHHRRQSPSVNHSQGVHFGVATGATSPNLDEGHCRPLALDSTAAPKTDGNIKDKVAADLVKQCFKRQKNTLWGRTLHKRLNRQLDFGVDALDSIFSAADTVFFSGRLRSKVEWRWSKDSESGYESDFVGTTTPRYSSNSSIEAIVVLSRPFLQSGKYNSNLLLSTFLHELVHCYLFICCGEWAQDNGGHTPGFKKIVHIIQYWSGNSELQLRKMRANLDEFLVENDSCCLRWPLSRAIPELVNLDTRLHLTRSWEERDEAVMVGRGRVLAEDSEATFIYDGFPSSWQASPHLPYVSRQELAGAVEGLASMPILMG